MTNEELEQRLQAQEEMIKRLHDEQVQSNTERAAQVEMINQLRAEQEQSNIERAAQDAKIKQLQVERDEAVRLSHEINDRMEEILKAVNKTSVEKMADAVKKAMSVVTMVVTKEQAFISNAGTTARNAGDRVWKAFQKVIHHAHSPCSCAPLKSR
jgi:membrane protein involved in colicin uptake